MPPSLIRSRISYCAATTCPLTITVPVAPSPLCFAKSSLAPSLRSRPVARSRRRVQPEHLGSLCALELAGRLIDLHAALQSDRGGNAPSAQFSDESLDPLSTRTPVLQPIHGIPGEEVHMELIPGTPTQVLTLCHA